MSLQTNNWENYYMDVESFDNIIITLLQDFERSTYAHLMFIFVDM